MVFMLISVAVLLLIDYNYNYAVKENCMFHQQNGMDKGCKKNCPNLPR
jgi:hypothetical protein